MRWTALVLSTKLAAGIYARGKQPPPVRPECGSVSRDNFWWGQIHPDRFNPDSAKKELEVCYGQCDRPIIDQRMHINLTARAQVTV